MPSVSIYTLGCKLNQLESEALADAFIHSGFSLHPGALVQPEPDIIIINTCTVTSRSDQKARRIIRKSLADTAHSLVIVTGCFAKLDREKILALDNGGLSFAAGSGSPRLFVSGEKSRLLDLPAYLAQHRGHDKTQMDKFEPLVAAWLENEGSPGEYSDTRCDMFRFIPRQFSFHTRGFIKIQDGCNNSCSFCRVRLARGRSVSKPMCNIREELQELEERGYWEAVLTGVNISQYHDEGLSGKKGLGELIQYLLAGTQTIGLRLSSLEPDYIDGDFTRFLAHPRLRPHFHLSVQSGSNSVLRGMGRVYTSDGVEQSIALLRSVKHNPFVACDIITGFPGESAEDFEETRKLCQKMEFAGIHAFPYSPRPGTAACSLPQTVPEKEAMRRVEILMSLARQGRQNYVKSWIGAELEALIENRSETRPGFCRGLSENYLKLWIRCPETAIPEPGSVVRCTIRELAPLAPEPKESGSGYDARAMAKNI